MKKLTQKEKLIENITHAFVDLYTDSKDFEDNYKVYGNDLVDDLQKCTINELNGIQADLSNKILNTLRK